MGFFDFLKPASKPVVPPSQPATHVSEAIPDFNNYSLQDIIEYFPRMGNTSGVLVHLSRRLLDLALTEPDVTDEDQNKALILYESVVKDIETGFASYPEGLNAFKTAQQAQFESIRLFGRGSLCWELSTPGLSEDGRVEIIINSANGHLIPIFANHFVELWADYKPKVLKKLILDRHRNGEMNSVIKLAGLVNISDPCAFNALTFAEKSALMNVSQDYKTARQELVNYKLLSDTSLALSFEPRGNPGNIALFASHLLKGDDEESPWNNEALAKHPLFNAEQQSNIEVTLIALRIFVWLETLQGVYGKEYSEQVSDNFQTLFKSSWEGIAHILDIIGNSKIEASKETATIGWDSMIAIGLMDTYLSDDDNKSEDEKMELWRLAGEVFNAEHVYWMNKTRFLLRFVVNDIEKRQDKFHLTDEEQDAYMAFGSFAENIESKSLYEDWIGTNQL